MEAASKIQWLLYEMEGYMRHTLRLSCEELDEVRRKEWAAGISDEADGEPPQMPVCDVMAEIERQLLADSDTLPEDFTATSHKAHEFEPEALKIRKIFKDDKIAEVQNKWSRTKQMVEKAGEKEDATPATDLLYDFELTAIGTLKNQKFKAYRR